MGWRRGGVTVSRDSRDGVTGAEAFAATASMASSTPTPCGIGMPENAFATHRVPSQTFWAMAAMTSRMRFASWESLRMMVSIPEMMGRLCGPMREG